MLETFAKKRKTNYGRVSKAGRKDKGVSKHSRILLEEPLRRLSALSLLAFAVSSYKNGFRFFLQKARFSAYMLWAREVRPDLMKANPHIGE